MTVNNLFAYDTKTKAVRRVTSHDTFDVFWPSSADRKRIVYEDGGSIYLFDPADGKSRKVPIRVEGDLPHTLPYFKNVSRGHRRDDPLPDRQAGPARPPAATSSRSPPRRGRSAISPSPPGCARWSATWSPDGRWIAYLSDRSGEYEIWLRPADGSGAERRVTTDGNIWRFPLSWSPDSKKLAFGDKNSRLRWVDVATGKVTDADRGATRRHPGLQLVAGQPLSRLHQDRGEPVPLDLDLLARRRQDPPAHHRPDRRGRAGLGPHGALPLLPLEPRLQPDLQRLRVRLRLHQPHPGLRRPPRQGRAGPLPARERRGDPQAGGRRRTTSPPGRGQGRRQQGGGREAAADEGRRRQGRQGAETGGAGEDRLRRLRAAGARHPRPAGQLPGARRQRRRRLLPARSTPRRRSAVAPHVQPQGPQGGHGPRRHRRLRPLGRRQEDHLPAGGRLRHRRRPAGAEAGGRQARPGEADPAHPAPRGVAPGVRRRLADLPRLVLRSQPPRRRLAGRSGTATPRCSPTCPTAPTSTTCSASSAASSRSATPTCSRRNAPAPKRVEGALLGAEIEADPSGYFRVDHIFPGENWHESFRSPLTEPGVHVESRRLHPGGGRPDHQGGGQLLPPARGEGRPGAHPAGEWQALHRRGRTRRGSGPSTTSRTSATSTGCRPTAPRSTSSRAAASATSTCRTPRSPATASCSSTSIRSPARTPRSSTTATTRGASSPTG